MLCLPRGILLLQRVYEKSTLFHQLKSNNQAWNVHKIPCEIMQNPPQITLGNYEEPVVVLITFLQRNFFYALFEDLLAQLATYAKVLEATDPESLKALVSKEKPTAIIIADSTVMGERYKRIRATFVDFAKSGGRVIFGCWWVANTDADEMREMFRSEWDLPWRRLGRYHKRFWLNAYRWSKLHIQGGLPETYEMRAFILKGAMKEDAVYVTEMEAKRDRAYWVSDRGRSPCLFTHIGAGWVGYIGDHYFWPGYTDVVLVMCGLMDRPI